MEFILSFYLSDPMTSMRPPRIWWHDLVEISSKIKQFLTDFLTLLTNNDEKGQAIFEMTVEGEIFEMATEEARWNH